MKSVNLNISFVFLMLLLFCLPNRAQPHESHSFGKIELPTLGSEAYAFDSHSNGPYTGLNDGRIVKYAGHKTGFVDFATTAPNRAQAHISHSFRKIKLPSLGSEAYAFDSHNNGPYTGLNDGRVVKYEGHKTGFVDFATTAPNRSKELCDGNNGDNPKTCQLCGRPIGLEFNHKTGELYIVDAIRGLMVVGSGGGVAERLAGGIDGAPFNAPDAIGIDPVTGDVYFTDIGTIFFKTRNMTEILLSGDTSGRLIKYNPTSRRLTVVLTGLAVPNGVAVSRDGSFVLVAEYIACRITRFWLKGPNANTCDTFVQLPGNPDNIKRTNSGDFWVPVNIQKLYPKLINFPLGQKISATGRIMETVNFYAEYNATYVTEVQERFGSLYVASVYTDFVGVYKRLKC